LTFQIDHTSGLHFQVQIVTLTRTFSDSSEYGVTTVGTSNVVNQFHDNDSLTDTSTTEETDLTSLRIWGQQIDDLDTSNQRFVRHSGVGKSRCRLMNGPSLSLYRTSVIYRISQDVQDTPKSGVTDRGGDGCSSVNDFQVTYQTFGGLHRNATHNTVGKVSRYLEGKITIERGFGSERVNTLQSVVELRFVATRERNIDDGTHDLYNFTLALIASCVSRLVLGVNTVEKNFTLLLGCHIRVDLFAEELLDGFRV
jgi:hypothetical protein